MGDYSKNLGKRVATRGLKTGHCAICRIKGLLTRDHVPPKCCGNTNTTELRFLAEQNNVAPTQSQGGTAFRSICANCNGGLLGSEYDPELGLLSDEVNQLVSSAYKKKIYLPDKFSFKAKPQRIARAIIGHLLAAISITDTKKVTENNGSIESLRNYFLNPTHALPRDIDIYYWVYTGCEQVVIKNFAVLNSSTLENFYGYAIKFPPLGFLITTDKNLPPNKAVCKLFDEKDIDLDHPALLDIKLSPLPRPDFPESPGENEVVMLNRKQGYKASQKKH